MNSSTKTTRPSHITCSLCGGQVAVAAKGNIPNAHFDCAELARTMRRLQAALDAIAANPDCNVREAVTIAKRDGFQMLNDSVNRYANPGKKARK